MNRDPDFFGNWCFSLPQLGALAATALGGYGDFKMYIEKRENISQKSQKITGTIEDQFGVAEFEGELSEQEIKFMKKYSQEAIALGAAPNGVRYHGRRHPDSFRGEFTVINGTSNGVRTDWNGEFYIIPQEAVRNS